MELHAVEGTRWPVAKLTLEPAELQARLGLRFSELDDNLGPVLFAFGQLDDGTVVGLSRLIDGREPGTDLYQFGDRPPRDVLSELLFETGLSYDEVSWVAAAEAWEDDRLWVRSRAEAYAYILLHVQPDDPTEDPVRAAETFDVDGDWVVRYRDIVVHLQPRPNGQTPTGVGVYSHPEDPPSTVIDLGGWMFIASQAEAEARDLLLGFGPRAIDAREYWRVFDLLVQADGSATEAMRFLSPGVDELPVRAFWTRLGQWMLRQNPQAFNRGVLEAKSAEYRDAIEEFTRVYGAPPRRQP
ncbi:hypothetical protein [Dactylosporangium maewongense]